MELDAIDWDSTIISAEADLQTQTKRSTGAFNNLRRYESIYPNI